MRRFADFVDHINAVCGRAAAWLVLVAVLTQFVVVVLRYVFGVGSTAMQETVLYAGSLAFLFAAGDALRQGALVRVDILHARLTPRTRDWIELAGSLLLLVPFAVVLAWFAVPYVGRAWSVLEVSREAGGLPLVFLFKSAILAFAALLALQGLAQAARAIERLRIRDARS